MVKIQCKRKAPFIVPLLCNFMGHLGTRKSYFKEMTIVPILEVVYLLV